MHPSSSIAKKRSASPSLHSTNSTKRGQSSLGRCTQKRTAMPAGTAIGLDKGYALEMVTAGDVNVEYDRLIDRQLERAAITSISGFAKLYTEASKVLTV